MEGVPGKPPRTKAVHVLTEGNRGPPTARTALLSLLGAPPEALEETRAIVVLLPPASSPSLSLPPSSSPPLPSTYPTDTAVPTQFPTFPFEDAVAGWTRRWIPGRLGTALLLPATQASLPSCSFLPFTPACLLRAGETDSRHWVAATNLR